jgi:hypothetical protein
MMRDEVMRARTRQLRQAKRDKDALLDLVEECDAYLAPNPKNSIGSGSILHQKMRDLLKEVAR